MSLALFFCLTSCFSPGKIVQIKSANNESVKWNYGREVILAHNGPFEARIFFEEFTKEHLLFDVEVVNTGDREVLLNPDDIYLLTNTGEKVRAFDPEKEIFGEQIERSKQEARSKNAALAVGAVAVAAVVTAAVVSDGEGEGNSNDSNEILDNTLDTYVLLNAAPPPPLIYLPPSIDFWKDYALRKTTLEKNYKVGGKVVFPRVDHAIGLTLVIPVGGVELRGHFTQRLFQP